jgi:hypothetical protein
MSLQGRLRHSPPIDLAEHCRSTTRISVDGPVWGRAHVGLNQIDGHCIAAHAHRGIRSAGVDSAADPDVVHRVQVRELLCGRDVENLV